MQIHAYPDPGQTLKSQTVKNVLMYECRKTYLRMYKSLFERQESKFICKQLVNFHGTGSGSAFPKGTDSDTDPVQDSQINVVPDPGIHNMTSKLE
jgi:hypothetical protein